MSERNQDSRRLRAAYIPGDGIGPEVSGVARRCVEASGVNMAWETLSLGEGAFLDSGHPFPPDTASALLRLGVALKAPLESGHGVLSRNPNGVLNELFGIFASIRHCRGFEGVPSALPGLDCLVIRRETWPQDGFIEADSREAAWETLRSLGAPEHGAASLRFVSAEDCREFMDFALGYARREGRRKVTIAHRSSINRRTDAIWLDAAEKASRRHPELELEDMLVDHLALQMVRFPGRFDTILVPEAEGDTIGNIGVSLAGGLGFVPEVLEGRKGRIFSTVHGTAPKYTALDRANPCAMILASAALLKDAGEAVPAECVVKAVREALEEGAKRAMQPGMSEPAGWAGLKEFSSELTARISSKCSGIRPPRTIGGGPSIPKGGLRPQ